MTRKDYILIADVFRDKLLREGRSVILEEVVAELASRLALRYPNFDMPKFISHVYRKDK